jgi:HEAT repeat protein
MSAPKKLSPEQHDSLLQRLHSTDELVRIQAAVRLTGSGVDAAVIRPRLEASLADPDARVRRVAAWVLARLPRQAAA